MAISRFLALCLASYANWADGLAAPGSAAASAVRYAEAALGFAEHRLTAEALTTTVLSAQGQPRYE